MNALRRKQFDFADDRADFGVDSWYDNQMDVLGHDYISENTETFYRFYFADGIDNDTAEFVAGKEWEFFMSAKSDESSAAVMIEMPEFHV